jgi:hypothetical protein
MKTKIAQILIEIKALERDNKKQLIYFYLITVSLTIIHKLL